MTRVYCLGGGGCTETKPLLTPGFSLPIVVFFTIHLRQYSECLRYIHPSHNLVYFLKLGPFSKDQFFIIVLTDLTHYPLLESPKQEDDEKLSLI